MRLVYDHQVFVRHEYGGISRYICEVADNLAARGEFDVEILAPFHVNRYLEDCTNVKVSGKRVPVIPKTGRLRLKINDIIVKSLLHKDPPDLVHETYYCANRLSSKKTKLVVTVHDMIAEKLGESFCPQGTGLSPKALAIERADHIICVSENTKKDLVEMLNISPKKVSVIHHGYSIRGCDNQQDQGRIVDQAYILYVGLRAYYKNFNRLLAAYASSSHLRKNFALVCIGGGQFRADEINEMKRLNLLERVIHLSGDDEYLANLYRHAAAFIYPSLYEGFGIPLLESMSFRCPVVCSNTSSFPEVAGDAAEYFDPYSAESMAQALETVVMSPERTEALISLGQKRIQFFSWQKCADRTREVYSSLT